MNANLKPLADLNAEQRTFLKQQVGTFVSKLNLQITRDQARLDNRLDRRVENQEKVQAIQDELTKKQAVLTALKQAGNIDADIIASQEEDVQRAQSDFDRLQSGPNTLTDVEAYLEQYEIDLMKLEKDFYQARFGEIESTN